MCHDNVDQAGLTGFFLFGLKHHEEIGNDSHEFPCHKEKDGIVCGKNKNHGENKGRIEKMKHAYVSFSMIM